MTKNAFVTGGTGFIGLNLIEQLVNDGWQVAALHRPTSDLSIIKRYPVSLVSGSVTDPDSLRELVPEGTDVVFHLAGDTNTWSKHNARQFDINVLGTRNMVEAAVAKGIPTFVHTSSVSAWGQISGHIDEMTPQTGGASWINYQRTKFLGELEALKGGDHGLNVVVLCPASVIGPYDRTSWGRVFLAIRDESVPITAPGAASYAHVRDVARAHITAAERGRPGERYILAGEPSSQAELVGEIARLLKKTPPPVAPPIAWQILGRLMVLSARLTGRPPLVTPELAAMMSRENLTYSSEKAIRELDYKIVPLTQAARDCYEWLVAENVI